MLARSDLHQYQTRGVGHIVQHPGSMLWLDMGLGKTITSLTAIVDLMVFSDVKKVLVVAPLRVCQTVWRQEAVNWEHTQHLTFSSMLGSEKKRIRAFNTEADVYLINYENLVWLSAYIKHYYFRKNLPCPFDMVVWDEVSKMKNATSNRSKAVEDLLPWIPRKVGLTGTPCSNGLKDLHGQFLAVDDGARLGINITAFRERFLKQKHNGFGYEPIPGAQAMIEGLIHDITLQMSAEDYLEVPELTLNDVYIPLSPKLRKQYDELEKEMVTNLDGGDEVAVFNAAALTNKLLQFTNGAVYKMPGSLEFHEVHKLKLDALVDIVEETGDTPILLAYLYKADKARILKKFKHAVSLSDAKGDEAEQMVLDWNAGRIKLMVGHPASMGHGLNLQHGGHTMVFYGLPWALDLYEQFVARLVRQGQTMPVTCHRILIDDSMDGVVRVALDGKATTQSQLREAIKKYAHGKPGIFT